MKCEVAAGLQIPNLGEKAFEAQHKVDNSMMRLNTEAEVQQHEQMNSPTASEGDMIYTLK